MSGQDLSTDRRAKIGYVDVVLTFATFVAFAVVSAWIYRIVEMLRATADPLTSALVGLLVPMLPIAILYSMGVSARS